MSRDTPHQGHEPIDMRLRTGDERLEQLGDFRWEVRDGGRRHLLVMLPTGKDEPWLCAFESEFTIDFPNHCGAKWGWDGNKETPTLSPSLHVIGIWHGWVRAGKLVEA